MNEQEVVDVAFKESPLEKLSKLLDEPRPETTVSVESIEEEEVVQVEMKESALEKLARMTGH